MMLTALYEFAEREGLLIDLDYEPRRIDLVLEIDGDGRLLGLVEPSQGLLLRVPRIERVRIRNLPGFIVDNVRYVLGIAGAKGKRVAKKRDEERALVQQSVRPRRTRCLGARA